VQESPARLKPGGSLMFELSPEQATDAMQLLTQAGFEHVESRNDLAGQARVVAGKWGGE